MPSGPRSVTPKHRSRDRMTGSVAAAVVDPALRVVKVIVIEGGCHGHGYAMHCHR